MAVRIALLLTILIRAGVACGQSTLIHQSSGRGFEARRAKFTPDGRYVLIAGAWTGDAAGEQPEFRVWDVHAGEFITEHRFDGLAAIEGLDVAPDGETLLVSVGHSGRRTSYNGHKVSVWDEEVWLWRWEARPVRPRSSRVRSVLAPIRRLMTVQGATPAPSTRFWGRVQFSPDADLVAVYRNETRPHGDWPEIRHHDRIDILESSGQLQTTIVPPDRLTGGATGTRGMAFSPDGRRLATLTLFDNAPDEIGYVVRFELRLWDVESGEELAQRSVIDSTARVVLDPGVYERVAFSPDGTLIASDGPDYTVQLWDVETLAPQRKLEGLDAGVHSLSFSPDGTLVAANAYRKPGEYQARFLLWDCSTGEVRWRIGADELPIREFEFSPEGAWLLTRSATSLQGRGVEVRLWDVNHLLAIGVDGDEANE